MPFPVIVFFLSQQEQKREAETEVQRRRSEAHNSLRKEARAWKVETCCLLLFFTDPPSVFVLRQRDELAGLKV